MGVPISNEIESIAFVTILLSALSAYVFYEAFVPRSLSGLQVAFPTGPKRYEVHTITANRAEAKNLLRTKGMRNGIMLYVMALFGAVLVAFEFLFYSMGISEGLSKISLSLALVFIALPAIFSSGVSLSAQLIKTKASEKASLQEISSFRTGISILITALWFVAVAIIGLILGLADVGWERRLAIMGLMSFAPSIVAYGRILGSSWTALKESSKALSKGEPSAFYPYKPGARKQFVSTLVYFNTSVMPLIAFNTLISLLLLIINPEMFQHTQQVLDLPEYRPQSSIMEEGGIMGFYIIELFSNISEAGIRVPLVTIVLLFLLFNVAIVGFLFVYEVARILFLDIADVSGKGGIRLADSRLLRSERSQQARVLNFCFTGFAGQSMLLLALAMLTFWDSQYLPQGAECRSWENSVCKIIRKDSLEELTWMLSSGGQIVFLGIWMLSRRTGQRLEDITFDATADQNREKLESLEKLIYRQEEPFMTLIAADQWSKALERMERLYDDHGEESMEGLYLARRTEASMELLAGLGRWDQAEQVALSFLALRAGRKAEIARLILASASLAQRDIPEALPRLDLLPDEDVETARLYWVSRILNPSKKLPEKFHTILSVDPVTKKNINLIRRYLEGAPASSSDWSDDPVGRYHLLGDIARFRAEGQSQIALDRFEAWIAKKDVDLDSWPHGIVARALLYLDRNMIASAVNLVEKAMKDHPRHPHLRRIAINLANRGEIEMPGSEPTGLIWADLMSGDWQKNWIATHNLAVAPDLSNSVMREHAWNANSWAVRSNMKVIKNRKKSWKKLDWQNPPMANHLLMTGLVITISGTPIDLGFPGWIDIEACEKAGLLDL